MNYIFETLLKYLIADLPLLITSFICIYLVIDTFLKKKSKTRKWITLISFEFTEHIIVPILLIIVLLFFDNFLVGILFNLILIGFIFGFIGYFVIGAKGKEWMNVFIVAIFVYFFIFFYPPILIGLQVYTPLNGWVIMGGTIIIFFITFRLLHTFKYFK